MTKYNFSVGKYVLHYNDKPVKLYILNKCKKAYFVRKKLCNKGKQKGNVTIQLKREQINDWSYGHSFGLRWASFVIK